ncbi:MAG: UDP-N-acetylmuramoyl-L-alanine--D-glutamate ligase [Eubacteriales bacterium]
MKKLDLFIHSHQKQKVAVIGMGVSNTPLIALLLDHDISTTVRDKNPDPEVQKKLEGRGAKFVTGEGYLEGLTEEVIFRTPGLSINHPALQKARAEGKKITSEMQEFFHFCPCPVIAVTGSDGKTTTTTLIAKFLEGTGKKVFLGGNIGQPLLCDIEEMKIEDIAVVELSSFQLMDLNCRPKVAVVTNLSPNHLDYHKDMEEYVASKCHIFTEQDSGQKVIFNQDNEASLEIVSLAKGTKKFFSRFSADSDVYLKEEGIFLKSRTECVLPFSKIQLKGVHNIENYMAAILAVEDYCSTEQIQSVAEDFFGVPHRMQLIRSLDGVNYYNDSIGTSPTRTIAGLHSFDRRIILIAGGYDKGIPFTEMGQEIKAYVKHLVLVGATATAIQKAVEESRDPKDLALSGELQSVSVETDLESAIVKAKSLSETGDDIVLSPACAAFDQFKNFVERGNFFEQVVKGFP